MTGPDDEELAALRARVAASRAAQGLPPVILDDAVLEQAAAAFALVVAAPARVVAGPS